MFFVCILFIKSNLFGQQITATFSADNSYAVYKGTPNNVTSKILPAGNSNGTSNSSNQQIFSPTANTIQIANDEWLYLIAWSDDADCQGLIGEFTGDRVLKTGDSGWQVYATGKDYDNNQSPTMQEINSHIQLANSSNAWTTPFVGPTNANGTQVCSGWRKVNGISDDAKWIWYNSTNQNSATTVFGSSINHKEYLIFRFPVRVINTSVDVGQCDCIPLTLYNEAVTYSLFSIENTSGDILNGTYKIKFQNPAFSHFNSQNLAWNNWINTKYGFSGGLTHSVVHQFMLFELLPNGQEQQIGDTFWIDTPNYNNPSIFNATLNYNKNYYIKHGVYYGQQNRGRSPLSDACPWLATDIYTIRQTGPGITPQLLFRTKAGNIIKAPSTSK
jgi:hypothetical protein